MPYNHKSMQLGAKLRLYITVVLTLSAATSALQAGEGRARMTVPGVRGVLELNVGPTTWKSRVRPDGLETQMQAMDRPDHLLITAFLQHVKFPASADRCRAEWWPGTENGSRSHNIRLDHVHQSMENEIARVEYTIPEAMGAPVKQKNVHVYLGSGELCAEIHISKVQFSPEEQKLFDVVLATVRLLPGEAQEQARPGVNEYFQQGSGLYLEKNYSAAAGQYQKALDLEKQKRTLNQDLFRVLVDNLGMSYGISGNLAKAKETFEYGITQDAEYPLFYYNMACTYGEMGKMDESLEQLRLAYKYKTNMIAGETLPDPLQDDSFRKFMNDGRFVRAVRELQKQ
jgi:hypothetical protein